MRVVHLFANHKFTGPADPAMVLAAEQQRLGLDVLFCAGADSEGESGVRTLARARGLVVNDRLRLAKHGRPWLVMRDVLRLRQLLAAHRPRIVHTHLAADHLIATLAARRLGVAVVRSFYEAEPPSGWRARTSLHYTHALLVHSPAVAARFVERHAALATRISVVEPPLDLARFAAREREPKLRAEWNAGQDEFVIGVVARMQTHRLFPELIEGFARVARTDPGLRLVILGRGTHSETVARAPARQSQVDAQIYFPGYIENREYPRYLPCFDALIFLVPGSDGTCRAAREALVSGVPVIASRRGLLPDLVENGETGVLLDAESPAAIADAIRALRADPARVERLGATARTRARARFDVQVVARAVGQVYERIVGDGVDS
ncbi:MAG: glycosyltransferase family 4 protein [Planctomycetota bacterium]